MRFIPFIVAAILCVVGTGCDQDMIPGADVEVKLKRLHTSKVSTPRDIAPYDDALSWQEYQVLDVEHGKLDSNVIRVAHWTVTSGKAVPISTKENETITLSLRKFNKDLGLDGVPMNDDLDLVKDHPRFLAMMPPEDKADQPQALRHDYNGHFSEQMKLYWKLRPQLRVVVMGNSHATKGISPRDLLGAENQTTPEALNLAPPGSNNDMQCLIVDDYLMGLPKLETVIWVISGRNFNSDREDRRKFKEFLASPGYEHDQLEKAKLWPVLSDNKLVTTTDLASLHLQESDSWGWSKRGMGSTPPLEPRDKFLEYLASKTEPVGFDWCENSWDRFSATVKKLNQKGITVFVLTTPMHPGMASVPPADPNGTTDEGFKSLVTHGRKLDQQQPLTAFHDFNELEKHEFKSEEFFDLDHLNKKGAHHLSSKIKTWIAQTNLHGQRRP